MPHIRRGGYIFVSWVGDHSPWHVHVFGRTGLIVKWDIENERPLKGVAPRRVVKLIKQLQREGRL